MANPITMIQIMVNGCGWHYYEYSGVLIGLPEDERFIRMFARCPGQDDMQLRLELVKCPNCGTEIEMFSREMKAMCCQCGNTVHRKSVPTCIDWCAAARYCSGEARWRI